ncbi:50S ribosomal protein L25/general stress protein Ctc [Mycoavidus sp. HKI]|uniref:50S ribosomal protein L25/general stress protein Ctc n=1 Tax=Mycoavidus sp. HKI TaxID=2840467 RepID=UPI001CC13841|nr:50S ribosomal protein L25/general stress protein Ctc [Mycoavidus sp. HKI]UAW64604.1 50S ribosomal protein L25/general stress protein Ctc [Mycoavidus sp. HKI]
MKIVAFERNLQGTGASRRLRNAGKTPAIVYGADSQPQLIELDHNVIFHALKKEAFHSSILELEIGSTSQPVLLRDVQYHPFKPLVLHVDFQRIDASKKLHKKVPLHFLNQDISKAVKLDGAILSHVMNELEVTCLPANLPEFIELDLADMGVGQSLHAKDVKLPEGVELMQYLEQENPVIVSATIPAAASAAENASAAVEGGEAPAAS